MGLQVNAAGEVSDEEHAATLLPNSAPPPTRVKNYLLPLESTTESMEFTKEKSAFAEPGLNVRLLKVCHAALPSTHQTNSTWYRCHHYAAQLEIITLTRALGSFALLVLYANANMLVACTCFGCCLLVQSRSAIYLI